MDYTGTFEGTIIGAGTKLRMEHSISGGNATVIASYGKDLKVVADKKWTCDVADPAKLAQVGDVWIHVTAIGGIDVIDGWMAVTHHGAAIVTLTVDEPDVVIPPPNDNITNSVTLDYGDAGEILGVWVNGIEFTRTPPPLPPVG